MDMGLSHNEYVALRDGYVHLRVPKDKPVWVIVEAAKATVALCRAQNVFRALVNASAFAEHPPSTGELFRLVVSVAGVVDFRLKIAVVDSVGWLQSDNFVITVARNRGLMFSVFSNEADAAAWLLIENPPR